MRISRDYLEIIMTTLTEILNSNEQVLIDGSVKNSGSCLRQCFGTKFFGELDTRPLGRECEELEQFRDVLKHPHARTIPQVTKELKTYFKKANERILYLHQRDVWRGKRRTAHKHPSPEPNQSKRLLENLRDLTSSIYHLSREKELKIQDLGYDVLTEMVMLIDRNIGLKKETRGTYTNGSARYRVNTFIPPNPNSDTDERLVSALYWLCMDSKNPPALLTGDTDFIRLLSITPVLMSADNFLPYNEYFMDSLQRNPFQLYLTRREEVKKIPIALPNPFPDFTIYNISPEQSKKVEAKMLALWKQFSGEVPSEQELAVMLG